MLENFPTCEPLRASSHGLMTLGMLGRVCQLCSEPNQVATFQPSETEEVSMGKRVKRSAGTLEWIREVQTAGA